MGNDYDFSGWATKNNIKCSDGRTILRDAFKGNDGQKVPLVWNHQHDDVNEVLGHALLENRPEGVYAYGKFNNTESGETAKALVENGDIVSLSIYANKLKTQSGNVMHGCIREVSLVLAGANPGAYIDSVITHGEGAEAEEEVIIYNDEFLSLEHSDDKSEENPSNEETTEEAVENTNDEKVEHSEETNDSNKENNKKEEPKDMEDNKEKTIGDIFETLTEEQKNAVYAVIGDALENSEKNENKGEENMKHNVFENDNENDVLQHSEIVNEAIKDWKKYGSMRDSFLAHAAINNMGDDYKEILFPDAVELNKEPGVIEKDQSWVSKVINGVTHTPFSRVKATYGRLTEEQARAKGYIKGNKKTNIQMSFLNRVTQPTTVYVKNEIDRDDVIDITSFDIIAWQKREMRKLLDRELALAILFGDGRDVSSQDKIDEQCIRPIMTDNDTYTIKYVVKKGVDYKNPNNSASDNDSVAKGVIRAAIKSRKEYKGSGKPSFYTTEDMLTELLLIEDQNGRLIYDSEEKLKTALRVKEIVTIPEMEKYTGVYAIIANLADYKAGADKGGAVSLFDDFDIDYNQMKYLIETRMSGALTVPYSAIVLKKEEATTVEG